MYKKIEEGIGNFHYKAPSNPEKLLYDFYFIISALGGKTGDQEVDFVLEDVLNSCVDNLQKHMIKALKYAIGAECRHLDGESSWDPNFLAKDFKGNFIAYATDLFGSRDSATLYKWYRKYYAEYKDDTLISLSKKKIDKYSSRLASIDKRKGKRNLTHGRSGGYAPSYYALLSAQKKIGISDATVGKLTASWFAGEKSNIEWRSSFGGKAWYDICKALESLAAAKTTSEKIIYIDHAYDLQHNTDSVFNKLRSYYQNGSLSWLKNALDWKRDVESLQGYYDKVSLSLKPFVAWISKNLYNTTIQQYKGTSEETPSKEWIKGESPSWKVVEPSIKEFEVGSWYVWKSERPASYWKEGPNWSASGDMNIILDGKPHKCTSVEKASSGNKTRASFEGMRNKWYWEDFIENFSKVEISKEKTSTPKEWPELKVGDKVVRGPDWSYGSQDHDAHGNPTTGIVINIDDAPWIDVKWAGGDSNSYIYKKDRHAIMPVSMLDDPKTSSEKWIPQVGEKVLVGPEWDAEEMDWDGKNDDGEYIIGTVTGVDRASELCFVEWPGVYEDYDSMYYWEDIQPASKVFPDNKAYKLSSKVTEEMPPLKVGDTVVRGPDWEKSWDAHILDENGNPTEGVVKNVTSIAGGAVRVLWGNKKIHLYPYHRGFYGVQLKKESQNSKASEKKASDWKGFEVGAAYKYVGPSNPNQGWSRMMREFMKPGRIYHCTHKTGLIGATFKEDPKESLWYWAPANSLGLNFLANSFIKVE